MSIPEPAPLPRAREIADAHRRGLTTVVATAEATLARIAAVEAELRCFAHLDPDAVMLRARELDELPEAARGPLHGVPVGVKDIIDTADSPTGYGSAIYAGHRPAGDAVAVARLRDAGALIVGKTVTTEFALFAPGPTRNPHAPSRTPGGSSSGSAAAVAAGLLPLALATQTAGSTVRPASFCGVVGAKPSFGRVPFVGAKHCAENLDTLGVMALDGSDARTTLAVMAGEPVTDDPAQDARPLRLGWWPGVAPARMDADARAVLDGALAGLGDRPGIQLVPIEFPDWFSDLIDAQQILMRHEVWRALEVERTVHADLLSPGLRAYLEAGPDAEGAARALALAARGRAELAAASVGLDAVLTPAVVGEAPDLATTGDPVFCRTWTLLGVPAVAVPGLRGPTGLPLGVQLVGPSGTDDTVLRAVDVLAPLLAGLSEGRPA